ncbi:actin-related protein 2/3 complex subunit 3-like [Tigriopus californicus]|uniref:actin-related protein 2/3 complex subunit 3-like n=1 Tax=Tigriopus californicus TaxID=6832 RepID=UPI0027DA4E68|nr:actin-related protein 2/3 complex subunit 3-like [Tigriopus californicus]
MPPYHSSVPFNDQKVISNIPLLPLKVTTKGTGTRGPAPVVANNTDRDIVDESLELFKANIFFSSFEIKDRSDQLLVYCILYIVLCLRMIQKCATKERAVKEMFTLALEKFDLPGDAGFPLNCYYEPAKSQQDRDTLHKYLTQIRSEIGARLLERVFDPKISVDGKPSKWWMCFARKRFLNVELSK